MLFCSILVFWPFCRLVSPFTQQIQHSTWKHVTRHWSTLIFFPYCVLNRLFTISKHHFLMLRIAPISNRTHSSSSHELILTILLFPRQVLWVKRICLRRSWWQMGLSEEYEEELWTQSNLLWMLLLERPRDVKKYNVGFSFAISSIYVQDQFARRRPDF